MKMDYNYHTHTFRCGHATGTPEEYIKRAVKNGIRYMGFSEHFPYVCRDGHEAKYRLPVSQTQDYFYELSFLREKYRENIEIRIGFELEYYPDLFEQMFADAKRYGAEYLILGQHFLCEEHPNGVYAMNANDSVDDLKLYVSNVVAGIESGVFTYVAHPDLFGFTGDSEVYTTEMRRICVASRENDVPIEINFLGIRGGRIYPDERFWRVAGEEGCPVVFGFDAHSADSAYDEESLAKAKKMVERFGLNYIGRPKIVNI